MFSTKAQKLFSQISTIFLEKNRLAYFLALFSVKERPDKKQKQVVSSETHAKEL